MKHDKSRKRMYSDHLWVANPIRPEDLDRHVTHQGVYPSLPVSHGVPWSAYVRSQRVSSRSVSSSTEALDSDQARQTTQRILQHTRSLPTNSPVPHILTTDREYRSDSGLSDRYTTKTPMATGVDKSSYIGYMTEHDRRMAATAQAWELENTLAENAYALEQNRQSITGYLPDPVTCLSLSSQPFYMNTVPRTTTVGVPIAESTLVPQIGPILHRPIPTP